MIRARRGASWPIRSRCAAGRGPAAVLASLVLLASTAATAQAPFASAVFPTAEAYGHWAVEALAAPPGNIRYLAPVEAELMARANHERRAQGLQPLVGSADLRAVARVHAADMIARGFFSHVNPEGRSPADRVGLLDRTYVGTTGENIGGISGRLRDGDALAARLHAIWIQSDDHRGNILRPDWSSVGIGVAVRGDQRVAVQMFGRERARVARPIPLRVPRGTRLELPAAGPGGRADFFDLWDPLRRQSVTRPFSITGPIAAPAGTYRVRYYFRRGNGFDIFNGPEIIVE